MREYTNEYLLVLALCCKGSIMNIWRAWLAKRRFKKNGAAVTFDWSNKASALEILKSLRDGELTEFEDWCSYPTGKKSRTPKLTIMFSAKVAEYVPVMVLKYKDNEAGVEDFD